MSAWWTTAAADALTAWALQVLAFALPLALTMRGASLFGVLELPWRRLAIVSTLLGGLILTPPLDGILLQLTDPAPSFMPLTIFDAGMHGLLFGLKIRMGLLVLECIANALESHLQLAPQGGPSPLGAFGTLTLSLWASAWWRDAGAPLRALTEPRPTLDVDALYALVAQLFVALNQALSFTATAVLAIVAAELGLGFIQRAFPQLTMWQLTLPLRLVIALQLLRVLLQRPLGAVA